MLAPAIAKTATTDVSARRIRRRRTLAIMIGARSRFSKTPRAIHCISRLISGSTSLIVIHHFRDYRFDFDLYAL